MNRDDRSTILVVDDEHGVRQSFNMVLKDEYNVLLAGTGKEMTEIFTKNSVDLILLDILLPDGNGLDLLANLKETDPNVEIIMVTAVNDVQAAVKAIKLGAYEYIIKPFVVDEVLTVIKRAFEKRSLKKEVAYLRNELERYQPFEEMVGQDKKMLKIFDLISTISKSDGTVLIQGESGTGKELVARAMHNRSPRKNNPFVVINCAAIPATLMESEIFGYNRGAFTGASNTSIGKLEISDKGTVFLDDIDSLDINMQAKLLRIIQEKEFERLGSNKIIKVDVRFVAASNKDINIMISQNKFREDLFYRLNVFPIKLPPLRARKDDIPLLLNHFIKLNAQNSGKPPKKISERAMKVLIDYHWPGNVRELQNLVERLCTITKDIVIRLKDVAPDNVNKTEIKDMTLKEAVSLFEKGYISETLESVSWNRKKAADKLGIHRNTLLAKTTELGLNSLK
ncbi:MAG: sigma-54-dependent Fis family transcriptional regulator [Desulfobacterales bacterium]|uniref:Sigma-54-dependent Fis family transcriptional regulator n=1 Tax=Candidatus Desulfatibia vada TaxID=2841696 RepID=A0A8J6P1R3_9BACT|nr:sigma-54-dependent Fis family transcriptional regulator [Candidatus Desulfatibia vada]MBL6971050.1 sigma-54-dependent Fis family transcriptional regulator [Desulfobacterales bacterium]